jgi:hypothetical protein
MFVADTLLPKVALLPRQAPLPYQGLHIYKCHLRWTMGSAALMSSTTRFGDTVVGLLAFVMARSHSSWHAHIRHGRATFVMARSHSSWQARIRHGPLTFVMAHSHSSWPAHIRHGPLTFVVARSHSSWPAHIRHGTACPGHLSRHGACSGGPAKPCHDGNDKPWHDGNDKPGHDGNEKSTAPRALTKASPNEQRRSVHAAIAPSARRARHLPG